MRFSSEMSALWTMTTGCPVNRPMSASPIPVLPEVASTMVPPGASAPDASAVRIMFSAMRSFDDPPGLRPSSFTSTRDSRPRVSECSSTTGVFPIRDATESNT